jgi:hypothetical protein
MAEEKPTGLTEKDLAGIDQAIPELLKAVTPMVQLALAVYREALAQKATATEAMHVTISYMAAMFKSGQ